MVSTQEGLLYTEYVVLPKREIIRVCNIFTIAPNNSILVW